MAATECTGSTSGNEAAPPPPPPPIETSVDLWDPFGQPGELRAAADAWDAVAAHLDDMRSHLDGVVRSSAAGWSGEAQRAFTAHWEQMAGELGNGSGGMREVAEQLRAMANELEAKNNLIQEIYVTIAATAAVSIATGFISFGAGFVAGAASVAANVARAERLLAAVKAFLVASRGVMAAVKATKVGAFAVRFGGFAAREVGEAAVMKKVVLDQNPLDPKNWSIGDAVFVAGGSMLRTRLAGRPGPSNVTPGPNGMNALSASGRARYTVKNWHSGTFPNRSQSITYHLGKHGRGRTAFQYTRDAQDFFAKNKHLATKGTLKDGTPGLRIQIKRPIPGGGTKKVGGWWTRDGRLVTFWD